MSLKVKGAPAKLLAVDLDGTLLGRNGSPHEVDVRALRAARAAGIHVTIVTGRLMAGTRDAARQIGCTGVVGCADGAHLLDAVTEKTVLLESLRGTEARALRSHLAAKPKHLVATYVFAGSTIVYDGAGAEHLGYVRTWSPQTERAADVHAHESWDSGDGVTAVVHVGAEAHVKDATRFVGTELGHAAQVLSFPLGGAGLWAMIARARQVSKGTALAFIAERAGVSLAETVAVGDWLNDVPMFDVAGRAYAMGQAPSEVKARAHAVVPETAEAGGGIARVVREVFGEWFSALR